MATKNTGVREEESTNNVRYENSQTVIYHKGVVNAKLLIPDEVEHETEGRLSV